MYLVQPFSEFVSFTILLRLQSACKPSRPKSRSFPSVNMYIPFKSKCVNFGQLAAKLRTPVSVTPFNDVKSKYSSSKHPSAKARTPALLIFAQCFRSKCFKARQPLPSQASATSVSWSQPWAIRVCSRGHPSERPKIPTSVIFQGRSLRLVSIHSNAGQRLATCFQQQQENKT